VHRRVRGSRLEPQFVNHLGIKVGNDPEKILEALDRDDFTEADIAYDTTGLASDQDYAQHVREVEANTPARFNADPRRLFEASGSAGKVMTFAVRLDTFPAEKEVETFYIGTYNPDELTAIPRYILMKFSDVPISGESIHRTAYSRTTSPRNTERTRSSPSNILAPTGCLPFLRRREVSSYLLVGWT
jgi:D-lactate dehydrogenase (quinone)